jgi:3',5'-cyclic AMP phosphodiesterase CpdA
MRLLHLSDVHVPVPLRAIPARDWVSKRAIGGLNYLVRRGPRFADAVSKLASLAVFAEEQNIDAVICSGDFTVLGTEPEHVAAAAAMAPLTKRPRGFFAVPGNHDVYLDDAVKNERFRRHFEPLIGGHGEQLIEGLATDGLYPRVWKLNDEVALIAIESARPNPQPWRSSGRIPSAQLEGLMRALAHPSLAACFKVVVTHYAPRLWDGRPDSRGHGLENADQLLLLLRDSQRTCLLHGHVHRRYAVKVPGVTPMLLCAGSTTEAGHSGGWIVDLGETSSAHPYLWRDGRYRLDTESPVVLLG